MFLSRIFVFPSLPGDPAGASSSLKRCCSDVKIAVVGFLELTALTTFEFLLGLRGVMVDCWFLCGTEWVVMTLEAVGGPTVSDWESTCGGQTPSDCENTRGRSTVLDWELKFSSCGVIFWLSTGAPFKLPAAFTGGFRLPRGSSISVCCSLRQRLDFSTSDAVEDEYPNTSWTSLRLQGILRCSQ